MKKFLSVLAFTISCFTVTAQTAEQIVDKAYTAAGGAANAEKIKTLKLTGSISVQGMEFPMTQHLIRGRGVRTEIPVMGSMVQMSYLDGKGWKQNPFEGAPEPTAMTEAELKEQQDQTSPVSPLFDGVKKGDKLELLGEETAGAEKLWKIRSTSSTGVSSTWFINSSYDIVKVISKREAAGQVQDIETAFSDYRQAEGVRLPYKLVNSAAGQVFLEINVDKYDFNIPVDEKIFAMPA
ncbi:MAG: hypothetical protein EOO09_20525, partial [Chitinophagaceae bacterium]